MIYFMDLANIIQKIETEINRARMIVLNAEMAVLHQRKLDAISEERVEMAGALGTLPPGFAAGVRAELEEQMPYLETEIGKSLASAMDLSRPDGPLVKMAEDIAEAIRKGAQDAEKELRAASVVQYGERETSEGSGAPQ